MTMQSRPKDSQPQPQGIIPYGRQTIDDDDIHAVAAALRSDYLTSGPEVERFETEFAAMAGAKHAVAVNSATAALHLAMKVLGIGSGDRVITTPNTFVASANAAAYVGATPDFSDICPGSWNLDPQQLEENWKPDAKAVVAVDYAGCPCNMPEIARIARQHGAKVIEDACHGVGSVFHAEGRPWRTGEHGWADITTFSFHPVKTMTTGEGGMLVTDNGEWADLARRLRSHGITRAPESFRGLTRPDDWQGSPQAGFPVDALRETGPWYYEMQDLGWNYRITDIQCALGRSQLRKLPQFIARRQEIARRYSEALADLPWLETPALAEPLVTEASAHQFHYGAGDVSLHLYTVQMDFVSLGHSRTRVMELLRSKGVGTQVLYIPVYLQPWYRRTFGYVPGKCPVAEKFYARALSLPLFPAMADEDVDRVISAVRSLTTS
ncbi:MAG: UDP-4-amino-4-deoxy-L-arabinose--oxoglutarate aminotransferase [Verrucomicrobiota bacterium]